ncbi:MAG: DUF1385 domain-containing protein [Actinobacteria bacterium]|nr:DUF1385 domain-containing protein [Actinomycetota bacterium]
MEPGALSNRLARLDAVPARARLGGLARPDGIVIVSERFWAFAGRDGSLREGTITAPPRALSKIPLLRGLIRLAASLTPLFHRSGVARPGERWLLSGAILAPCGFMFLPERASLVAGVVLTGLLVCWLLRGRTLALHGAEHRAIAAAEEGRLQATWSGLARPSRFASRCGTNFAVLVLPVAVAADRLWPVSTAFYTPAVVAVLSLALSMELWLAVQAARGFGRIFLVPGLALQRLTTREPRLDETRLALVAAASVLERELAAPASVA